MWRKKWLSAYSSRYTVNIVCLIMTTLNTKMCKQYTYRLVEYRKRSGLPLLPDAVVFLPPLPSVSLRVVPVQVPYSPHPQQEKEQCPWSKTIFTSHCPSWNYSEKLLTRNQIADQINPELYSSMCCCCVGPSQCHLDSSHINSLVQHGEIVIFMRDYIVLSHVDSCFYWRLHVSMF